MNDGERNPEDLLLDWRLGLLDEEQRAWLEAELDRDAALQARNRRLGRALQPLEHWTVPPTPSNLPDRVLAYIHERTRTGTTKLTSEPEPRRFVGASVFRIREMLAAAACVAILFGVIMPGLSNVRERSRQAVCANNLNSLFLSASAYQESFAGSLPYAGNLANAVWLPTASSDRPYASNSRHLFLLAKLGFGTKMQDFICPSDRDAEPMRVSDPAAHDDFARACNVTYDSLNLSGSAPNLRPAAPVLYAGDRNPLFVRARFNEEVDADTTNSPAHGGRGQTVLALDGTARWVTSPFYGAKRDNIWLAGNIRHYTGGEAPIGEDDVQLIPGYPAGECKRSAIQHR